MNDNGHMPAQLFGSPVRRVNENGIKLIQSFETCKLAAYLDPRLIPTIGWGHTLGVKMGDTCTQEQADIWLDMDLGIAEHCVSEAVKVYLNDNQYAALVSFTFNTGTGHFCGSTLLKLLNRGWYDVVPVQLARWNKINGAPCDGLTRRRAAESKLWNTPC